MTSGHEKYKQIIYCNGQRPKAALSASKDRKERGDIIDI